MMRKSLFLALFMTAAVSLSAQMKFAFVDTKYVLENMPAYAEAQGELDAAAAQWQTEIEDRYATIERMYKAYQAEAVLLTEEMRLKREEEITRMESEAKNLQKQRFGVEGDLFKKRQELIQPIQEQIFNAIREFANEGGYEAIFDRSGQAGVLYANPKYDKSDRILRKMGIRPGQNTKSDSDSDQGREGSGGSSPQRNTGDSPRGK
ncbi:MAG: OmpH family outer membrane protein [Flavobacteriales bacterium]|nr:OmpH family outer membrane protein [Flavobacteriales bacterium]